MQLQRLVLPLALALVVACGADKPTQTPENTSVLPSRPPPEPLPGDTLAQAPAPSGAAAIAPLASGSAAPSAPTSFTDGQIASICDAANAEEVDQGKLALAKATDARVKQFARLMVTHHGDAKTRQAALLEKSNTVPEVTATSQALAKSGTDALELLKRTNGAAFDRAYVDLQVKEHRDALALLDDKLLPAVHDRDLGQALGEARTRMAEHLAAAEALQAALAGASKKKP